MATQVSLELKIIGVVFVILGIITLAGTYSLNQFTMGIGAQLHKTCPLPPEICPYDTIPWQSIVLGMVGVIIVALGLWLFRRGGNITRQEKSEVRQRQKSVSTLREDEKKVFELVEHSGGVMFQSALIEATGYSKVKMSRIIDTLEGMGLVERRRRGMTNVVMLK